MGVNFKLKKQPRQIIKDSGIDEAAVLFAAKTSLDLMREYVPMDTGALAENTQISIENGKSSIHFLQPYAKYCYYGEKKKFSREKNRKATAYWDKVMYKLHKNLLALKTSEFIKKR